MKKTVFDADRRRALRAAGLAGLGILSSSLLTSHTAKAVSRAKTPVQPEGPFYPVKDQLDKDADMTRVLDGTASAVGDVVILHGIVRDAETSAPIKGALVEFWQACASGKYDHPDDPNPAPLDSNFQFWAQVQTDHQGRFGLKTIRPGAYPADEGWVRPPHIHVKIHSPGYPSLTTQIYFKGEPLNDEDLILRKLSQEKQNLVVVDFYEGDGTFRGEWTAWISPSSRGRARLTGTPQLD